MDIPCPKCSVILQLAGKPTVASVECPRCHTQVALSKSGLLPGDEIGGFKVEKKLGEGGMGEVWLARQVTLDRPVALKILAPELSRDAPFIERFLEEVKVAARLIHPNIVTALGAGQDKGFYYLATSYVHGEELDKLLKRVRRMPEREALLIVQGIAEALRFAWHKFSIVHRDVKPGNIMLSSTGEVMLMDVGISRSGKEDASLSVTGDIVGTPEYMSPEQARADQQLDFRSDVYSLGVTLYQLVTGELPFVSTTALGTMTKHITDPIPPPREKNPEISSECAALIEIMMAKRRRARQKSWDDAIRDIGLVIEGKMPATAKPRDGQKSLTQKIDVTAAPRAPAKKIVMKHTQLAQTLQDLNAKPSSWPSAVASLFVLALLAGSAYFARDKIRSLFIPPENVPGEDVNITVSTNDITQESEAAAESTTGMAAESEAVEVISPEEQAAADAQAAVRVAVNGVLNDTASDLLNGKIRAAEARCEQFLTNNPPESERSRLEQAVNMLKQLSDLDKTVLETFRKDIGQEIDLVVAEKPEKLVITDVKDGFIVAERRIGKGVSAEVDVSPKQLTREERNKRLQGVVSPEIIALYTGIIANHDGHFEDARSQLEQTGVLAEFLVKKLPSE